MYDPEDPRQVPDYLKSYVIALRRKALGDTAYATASPKSIQKLVVVISKSTTNPKNRIPILQALTGLPLTSSKSLTQGYVSALIEETELVIRNYPAALTLIEGLLKITTGREPWRLFPWDAPKFDLPVLQHEDTGSAGDARSPVVPGQDPG